MRATTAIVTAFASLAALTISPAAGAAQAPESRPLPPQPDSTVTELVSRLTLDQYKATIVGLTKFGDRRQGTQRNRDAVDWIEAKLKSYGCQDVQRLTYDYTQREFTRRPMTPADSAARARAMAARRTQRQPSEWSVGGGRYRGNRARTGVNTDSLRQPDPAIRALDTEQTPPGTSQRQEVFCTKIGSVHPDEAYIVGGHMDGIGWGQAANDDGSGTAIVMEMARILNAPGVTTDRSVRFVLWNNEETGLNGSRAYVEQREALQGKEDPPGSGKYPEPRWLGMIQHDMMMWDHGAPRADGTVSPKQRPEADVNVEFQSQSKMAAESQKLAWIFESANEKYATDYPAAVGPHMTNTDSDPFKDICPTISMRENFRGSQIGAGWDPNWHQPTDVLSTYTDDDYRLGLNAAQTTLGAVSELVGVHIKP